VLLKGTETLALRVEAMGARASRIAERLATAPEVAFVRYPFEASHPQRELAGRLMKGGGTLVTFELRGGKAAAFAFCDALQLVDISNNLGDARSLITHPASTTHFRIGAEERAKLGISDGVLRLSVGLEDVEDLLVDLERGLAAVRKGGDR
jgi:O-succinylhomoserine sulfhydrylase